MGIPHVEDPTALSLADQLARRYRSLVVRVAPKVIVGSKETALWEKELRTYGYYWDTPALVPTKTLVLDLGLSKMDLVRFKAGVGYRILERFAVPHAPATAGFRLTSDWTIRLPA